MIEQQVTVAIGQTVQDFGDYIGNGFRLRRLLDQIVLTLMGHPLAGPDVFNPGVQKVADLPGHLTGGERSHGVFGQNNPTDEVDPSYIVGAVASIEQARVAVLDAVAGRIDAEEAKRAV